MLSAQQMLDEIPAEGFTAQDLARLLNTLTIEDIREKRSGFPAPPPNSLTLRPKSAKSFDLYRQLLGQF